MMRSPERVATAVRVPDGRILVKTENYISLSKRHKLLNLPILRGAVTFVEMLVLGIKTLNFSADIAIKEQEKLDAEEKGDAVDPKERKSNSLMLGLTVAFGHARGILILLLVPRANYKKLKFSCPCNRNLI